MTVPPVRDESQSRWWWAWVAAGILLAVSTGGPDFGRYSDWADAVLRTDIFVLRGDVQSPEGVPYSQWAAAPGVMFALSWLALGGVVDLFIASLVTGWLAALAFWCAAFVALRRIAGGDRNLVLLGMGALFVGTHAGFYSHNYSTEVFATAFVAMLWALAWKRHRWTLVDALAAGALIALLILIRPFLAVYALPALWTGLVSQHEAESSAGATRRTWMRRIAFSATVAVPILLAFAQHAVINRWMTGSALQSPYSFGGAGFQSLDLRNPELAAVLTHSWHGLLTYHPLFGVAFVALIAAAWRSDRMIWGTTLVAVLVHVWIQAGWYVWWLGTDTFGMRGMAPAALPLVGALMATIRHAARRSSVAASLWTGALLLCCAWSMSLLLAGRTQFLTWPELLASEHQRMTGLIAGLVVAVWGLRHLNGSARDTSDGKPASAVHATDAVLLAGLAFGYLFMQAIMLEEDRLQHAALGVAGTLTVAVVATIVGWMHRRDRIPPIAAFLRRHALPLAAIVLFCAQALLFSRLAIATEQHLASGAPAPRQFRHVSASPLGEVEDSYAEYLLVSGFEDKKAALRGFLREQGILRPDDSFLVSLVKEALAADEMVGGVPIDVASMNGVVQLISDKTNADHRVRAIAVASGVAGVLRVEDRMR